MSKTRKKADEPPEDGQGNRRPLSPPRNQPKLNPLERYQRGRQIAEMRARKRPVAWKTIAKAVGVSERQANEIYRQFLLWEEPQHDPMKAVDETIDVMTVAMHGALETYMEAKEGSSVRVAALKTAVETAAARLQIMRAAGRAPRSLAAPSMVAEMQLVFREFAELLRRHDVGDDALREFLELAETRMGRLTAIDARALPSAA
jgi:hypothetical protein